MKIKIYQPDPQKGRRPPCRDPKDVLKSDAKNYSLVYEGEVSSIEDVIATFENVERMPADYHGAPLHDGDLIVIGEQIHVVYTLDQWSDAELRPVAKIEDFDLSQATNHTNQICGVFLPVGQYASIRWVSADPELLYNELGLYNHQVVNIPFHMAQLVCTTEALDDWNPSPKDMNRALINNNWNPGAIGAVIQGDAFFCRYADGVYRSLGEAQCKSLKDDYYRPERLHALKGGRLVAFQYYPETVKRKRSNDDYCHLEQIACIYQETEKGSS